MITGNPAISVERVEYYLKRILKVYPEIPKLVMAELGEVGGLHGGLAYINAISVKNI